MLPYFYSILTHLVSGVTAFCGSVPKISAQPDKMEANTGTKGRQTAMFLVQTLAHIVPETARSEGNVPTESAAARQGATSVAQQGKAIHHLFDITPSSPLSSNA